MKDLAAITGQKPVPTKARTSIASFKLREGMVIGAKVTLRKDRMYEFLDRLITIALPRVKDFRGLKPTSFDGRGNYAMGLREHIVFPEINYDEIDQIWGMDIIVCTTAGTDDEARALLKEFQFPFNANVSGEKDTTWPRRAPSTATRWSSAWSSQTAAKRDALKAIANDENLSLEERFEARLKLAELPRNSSPTPHPQPLRGHRAAARLLSQAEDEPDRAARAGLGRADPRPREVELVRRV